MESCEMNTKFWSEYVERDHLEYLGVDGRIILKWILWEVGGKVWMNST